MEQERTCKTCKHWNRHPLKHSQDEGTGQCGKLGIQQMARNTAAIAPYAFGRPPGIQALLTGGWFTCYFWEAAPLFGLAPTAQLGEPRFEINIPPVPDLSSLSGFADFTQAIEAVGEAVQKLRDAGIAIVAEAKAGRDD